MLLKLIFIAFIGSVFCDELDDIIPARFLYKYNVNELKNVYHRRYTLHEVLPSSGLLCPKHSFIAKISYSLSSKPSKLFHHSLNKTSANSDVQDVCPTIGQCLGYQACVFHYGIDFCGLDPIPGERKILDLNLTCVNDDNANFQSPNLSNDVIQRREKIVNLKFKIRKKYPNEKRQNDVEFLTYDVNEAEVFHSKCSSSADLIFSDGFRGNCTEQPPDADVVIENLWFNLARAPQASCREELRLAYCALQYNSFGQCIPPQFIDKSNSPSFNDFKFNFKVLPKRGYRPELKEEKTSIPLSLVPVKLAFCIMVHQDAMAVLQLLGAIYRPEHFYVLHVDVTNSKFRSVLQSGLHQFSIGRDNVRLLPVERSFHASWGSYNILRAQFECFEELLRMGIWDFVINLSGSDLPIRNIDDLAAALAPERGNVLVPYEAAQNSIESQYAATFDSAYYSCGGFGYNVTKMKGIPDFNDIEIHSGSNWGVFSRDFIDHVLDMDQRSSILNKYQFYLQLIIIPDETYLVSAAFNSKFKKKVKVVGIHEFKPFKSVDDLNICRHVDEVDFCGQGPGEITTEDLDMVADTSNWRFFMRKFPTKSVDAPERIDTLNMIKVYTSHILSYLPKDMLRNVVKKTILEKFGSDYSYEEITNTRIIPTLSPHDEACDDPFRQRISSTIVYTYLIDFSMRLHGSSILKHVRVSLHSRPSQKCFSSSGQFRMLYATTWTYLDPEMGSIGLTSPVPIPFFPTNEPSVWLMLYFTATDFHANKLDDSEIGFNDIDFKNVTATPIPIQLVLSNENGEVCTIKSTLRWDDETVSFDEERPYLKRTEMIQRIKMNCGPFNSGWHTLSISKLRVKNAAVYQFKMYLMDFDRKNVLTNLASLIELWQLQEIAIISEEEVPVTTTATYNYKSNAVDGNFCVLPSIVEWLICYGGFSTLSLVFVIGWYWISLFMRSTGHIRRKTWKNLRHFIIFILVISVIQISMFSNCVS